MSKAIKVGVLGHCPVCEGEFKTRNGKLVHHGFTRPGDGMIHGDCFAVDYEPYERSTKGCEDYKAMVLRHLADLEETLKALPLRTSFREYNPRNHSFRDYAIGVTDLYTWERFVENKIYDVKQRIRSCTTEIARMDRRIAAWSLKDLKTVTEEAASAQLKAERDARKAERDAKNAAKAAKAAALQAKRDAKAAEKKAFIDAFIAKVQAAKGDKVAINQAVTEFKAPKNVRKFGYIWVADWNDDHKETLIEAGLASRSPTGFVSLDI